jgi:hypothetical protein
MASTDYWDRHSTRYSTYSGRNSVQPSRPSSIHSARPSIHSGHHSAYSAHSVPVSTAGNFRKSIIVHNASTKAKSLVCRISSFHTYTICTSPAQIQKHEVHSRNSVREAVGRRQRQGETTGYSDILGVHTLGIRHWWLRLLAGI